MRPYGPTQRGHDQRVSSGNISSTVVQLAAHGLSPSAIRPSQHSHQRSRHTVKVAPTALDCSPLRSYVCYSLRSCTAQPPSSSGGSAGVLVRSRKLVAPLCSGEGPGAAPLDAAPSSATTPEMLTRCSCTSCDSAATSCARSGGQKAGRRAEESDEGVEQWRMDDLGAMGRPQRSLLDATKQAPRTHARRPGAAAGRRTSPACERLRPSSRAACPPTAPASLFRPRTA